MIVIMIKDETYSYNLVNTEGSCFRKGKRYDAYSDWLNTQGVNCYQFHIYSGLSSLTLSKTYIICEFDKFDYSKMGHHT